MKAIEETQKQYPIQKLQPIVNCYFLSTQKFQPKTIKKFQEVFNIKQQSLTVSQVKAQKSHFMQIFKQMILSTAQQVYLQGRRKDEMTPKAKNNIIKGQRFYNIFIHIEFNNLKVLNIKLGFESSFEWISYLHAQSLKQLVIITQTYFTNMKTLFKTKFMSLQRFFINKFDDKLKSPCLQITNFSRMKFLTSTEYEPPGWEALLERQEVRFSFNYNFSKISSHHAKFQSRFIENFEEQEKGMNDSNVPTIYQSKLYSVLNKKFRNKTLYLNQYLAMRAEYFRRMRGQPN